MSLSFWAEEVGRGGAAPVGRAKKNTYRWGGAG